MILVQVVDTKNLKILPSAMIVALHNEGKKVLAGEEEVVILSLGM